MASASVSARTTMTGAHGKTPLHGNAPLTQSRETGEVNPESRQAGAPITSGAKGTSFAKSWAHMVAGGIGGMTAATLTAPLDVLKTRLQSDFYQAQIKASRASIITPMNPLRTVVFHFNETMSILGSVYRQEGPRALFKGLGPNLIGVIPARSINFFTYGNGKRIIGEHFNNPDSPWVHLGAGALAGVTTSTATNPIWMVKTRLQLDKNMAIESGGATKRRYKNSLDCIRQVLRDEGIHGMYKGMSASYLGVAESTMHWMLYERIKQSLAAREERIVLSGRAKNWWDYTVDWTGKFGAAGFSKFIAAVISYPHEVARTRLRQAPLADGRPKYTGLVQCFKLVFKEEGMLGLYGGLTPHLLRTVPSAAIMFGMYEGILRLLDTPA